MQNTTLLFRYERKLEEDIANYNPFGRGGGGAPIKDASGQAIGRSYWQRSGLSCSKHC